MAMFAMRELGFSRNLGGIWICHFLVNNPAKWASGFILAIPEIIFPLRGKNSARDKDEYQKP